MLRAAAVAVALLALSCGPKSISARREHGQKISDQAEDDLGRAERAMQELDAETAAKALADAKKLLQDPDAQLYPDYEMLTGRQKEDEAKLPDVKKAREARDLALAIGKLKDRLDELTKRAKAAVKALDTGQIEKGLVDAATSALGELGDALKEGADFEKRDAMYGDYAKGKRELAEKLKEPVGLARARLDYIEGPVALRDKALEKLKEGKTSKGSDEKKAAFAEAKKLYDQCQDASRKALTANPAISRLPIVAAGKKTTPEALDTACSAEWQDVDKAEKKIKPDKKKKK